MHYWFQALREAFAESWEFVAQVDLAITLLGGFVIVAWKALPSTKWKLNPDHPILSEAWRLLLIFGAVFVVSMFVIIPYRMFEDEHAARLGAERERREALTLVNSEMNNAKAAEDRATRLSDAAITGKILPGDEPLISLSASGYFLIAKDPRLHQGVYMTVTAASVTFARRGVAIASIGIPGLSLVAELKESGMNYEFSGTAVPEDMWLGKPSSILSATDTVEVEIAPDILPAGVSVTEGTIICVINNHYPIHFEVPTQMAKEGFLTATPNNKFTYFFAKEITHEFDLFTEVCITD
jgi:hypothetical protein